jgi:hypothetical protein
MTQNSILDHNIPFGVIFPARSSPFVCAADIVDVLVGLYTYMDNGLSAPKAARRVVYDRMWRHNPDEANRDLPLANQHPWTHTIVFIFGVLPQTIKLFGMRGIPWTQACGALYLSSFLVIAGVGALARSAENDNDRVEVAANRTTTMSLMFGAVAMQVGIWAYWAADLLHPSWGSLEGSTTHILLALPIPVILGWVIGTALYLFLALSRAIVPAVLLVMLFCYGPFFLLDYLIIADYISIATFVFLLAFFVAMAIPSFAIIPFGLANLVMFIHYYRFIYDPTGTMKPAWAERLG